MLSSCAAVVVVTADQPDNTPRSESISEFYAGVASSIAPADALPPNPAARARLAQAERLHAADEAA